MARVCMRPGCDRPADARLSYDTISCQVWLDQMPERLGPVQEICEFHAERLTVPRGWTLCDRRVDAPALFVEDRRYVAPTSSRASVPPPSEVSRVDAPDGVAGSGSVGSTTPLPIGRPVPTTSAARRSTRRRHPASTARQLFGDDRSGDGVTDDRVGSGSPLEVVAPLDTADAVPLDLDSDLDLELELVVELDLDSDLDAVVESDQVGHVSRMSESEPGNDRDSNDSNDSDGNDAADAPSGGLDQVLDAVARTDATADEPELAPAASRPDHAEVMAQIVSVDVTEAGDPDDDLPASLRATSPLLARAFRATGPQRSVLTDDLANPRPRRTSDE